MPLGLPGYGARTACLVDLDGNGWVDVFLGGHHTGTAHSGALSTLFYNGPDGLSVEPDAFLQVDGADDCAAADLDQDGWPELIVASNEDDRTYDVPSSIFWGSAQGFSDERRSFLESFGARGVLVVDLDQDGWHELVFANGSSGPRQQDGKLGPDNETVLDSVIYVGGPSGYSAERSWGIQTDFATGVRAADLNADGWLDLIFSQVTGPLIWWGHPEGLSWHGSNHAQAASRRGLRRGCGGPGRRRLARPGPLDHG